MYLTFDTTDYEERWFNINPSHSLNNNISGGEIRK